MFTFIIVYFSCYFFASSRTKQSNFLLTMNSPFNPDNYSLSELLKMGYFTLPPRDELLHQETLPPQITITHSGRVSKRPSTFQSEQYVKGSGCCKSNGCDSTDMTYY